MQRVILFRILLVMVILAMGCGDDNYLRSLSNNDSDSACQYQISMDLDSGNYDAVIASSCANYMDMAAAYLGKAGFEIFNIVNSMIKSNDSDDKPLKTFMNELAGSKTTQEIRDLDYSMSHYSLVNTANGYSPDQEKDAMFIRDILMMPAISYMFLKLAMDPDGDGEISGCDINGNNVPDEVDATSCALIVAGGTVDCSSRGITLDDSTYRTLNFPDHLGIYNGLIMNYAGATNTTCPDNKYYKLLYGGNSVAVTTIEKCIDASYPDVPPVEWNCPYEDSQGKPGDLLKAFNDGLQDSFSTMYSIGFSHDSEIYMSVNSVSTDACGGGSNDCSETDLQTYLDIQMGL